MVRAAVTSSAAGMEALHRIDDIADLLLGQVLVGRKGDDLASVAVGDGEVSRRVTEMPKPALLVQGDRIMNLRLDTVVQAVPQQGVPVFGEHNVEMINAPAAGGARRNA